jgi:hypothetical protein
MKLRGLFIAAAVLLMPTAALAAPGIVTTTVVVEDLASDTDGTARGLDDFRVAHGRRLSGKIF